MLGLSFRQYFCQSTIVKHLLVSVVEQEVVNALL